MTADGKWDATRPLGGAVGARLHATVGGMRGWYRRWSFWPQLEVVQGVVLGRVSRRKSGVEHGGATSGGVGVRLGRPSWLPSSPLFFCTRFSLDLSLLL
ncbi:MFS general substrate transporter [Sesbania bispinosa]|nr:MFS general substrate transporter [Sesbania bispinosa]